MKKINIKILPAIVTLGNLFCGFLAVVYIADAKLEAAAWLIFLGMVFDMLDGKVARLTKGSSDFGAQLDSLSDMISFGVAPAFLIKVHILQMPCPFPARVVWVFCLLYVICAALRLARFNVETDHDESSHLYFQGLATPAAAGVLASLVLVYPLLTELIAIIYFKIFTLGIIFSLGVLMVSRVRYLHIGIYLLKKRRPVTDLIFMIFFIALVAMEPRIFVLTLTAAFVGYAFVVPATGIVSYLRPLRHQEYAEEEISYHEPVGGCNPIISAKTSLSRSDIDGRFS